MQDKPYKNKLLNLEKKSILYFLESYTPSYENNRFLLIDDVHEMNELVSKIHKNKIKQNKLKQSFKGYKILSEKRHVIGFACVLLSFKKESPEILFFLEKGHNTLSTKKIVHTEFIDWIFAQQFFNKLYFYSIEKDYPIKELYKIGYIVQKRIKVEGDILIEFSITKYDRALSFISEIIKKEKDNLNPITKDLAGQESERVRMLWSTYFRKGIPLSNGGVDTSILNFKDLRNKINLESFYTYRPDRPSSVSLPSSTIKKFFIQEKIITSSISRNVEILFSMGAHEGFSRILRCIYHRINNNGIFYPQGSYGLMASAAAHMKPAAYILHFIKTNPINGKIILEDFAALCIYNRNAKTLFLEMKTTAGALYTKEEIENIIKICKRNHICFIADIAHFKIELKSQKFPDIVSICTQMEYKDYVLLFTGSKTYGLERARVGFIIINHENDFSKPKIIAQDFINTFGSTSDLPFEVAYALFNIRLEQRKHYLKLRQNQYIFNLNLMIGYIEGIKSNNISKKYLKSITKEIDKKYQDGLKGISIQYLPEAGIHILVSTYNLRELYFGNIKLLNSEIFSYVLYAFSKVVTLHSFQILDPTGYSLRLSFGIKKHIHTGMKAIHDLLNHLTLKPSIKTSRP